FPHQLAGDQRTIGERHLPGMAAPAAVGHDKTVVTGDRGEVLPAGLAVRLERVVLGPALRQWPAMETLGLELGQDVEDVAATVHGLADPGVVRSARVLLGLPHLAHPDT